MVATTVFGPCPSKLSRIARRLPHFSVRELQQHQNQLAEVPLGPKISSCELVKVTKPIPEHPLNNGQSVRESDHPY